MGVWSEYPELLIEYDKNVNSRIDEREARQAVRDQRAGRLSASEALALIETYNNKYGLYALPEVTRFRPSLSEAQPGEEFQVSVRIRNTDTKKGCLRDGLTNCTYSYVLEEYSKAGNLKIGPKGAYEMSFSHEMSFDLVRRGVARPYILFCPSIGREIQTRDPYPKKEELRVKMLPLTTIEITKAPDRVRPGRTFSLRTTIKNTGWAGTVRARYVELSTGKSTTRSIDIDTKGSKEIDGEVTMLPFHTCRYKVFSETRSRTRGWLMDDESTELVVRPKMCVLVFSENKTLTIYGDEEGLGFKGVIAGRGIKGFDLPPTGGPFKGQAGLEGRTLSWESLSYLRLELDRGVTVGEDGEIVDKDTTSYQIGPVLPGTETSFIAFTRPARKMLAFEPPVSPLVRFRR